MTQATGFSFGGAEPSSSSASQNSQVDCTVEISMDGHQAFIDARRQAVKKRKLRAGEVPAPLSDWIPQEDWLSTCDDVEADGHDNYKQFEMTAWQQHTSHFAMDASGELREDVGPRTGKRK